MVIDWSEYKLYDKELEFCMLKHSQHLQVFLLLCSEYGWNTASFASESGL